ncbi:MAG: EAL domain-containing protein [Roseibium sp.]
MLYALQRSLALMLPLMMVGALALLLLYPPFPQLKTLLGMVFGSQFDQVLSILISSTFGLAAILILCGYAHVYTTVINQRSGTHLISPVLSVLVATTSFIVIVAPNDQSSLLEAMSMNHGLPVAILVAITSTEIFLRLARVRALRIPTSAVGHEGVVGDVFSVMPAVILTIVVFGAIKAGFLTAGSADVIGEFNAALGGTLATGEDNLAFGLTFITVSQVLWFFGVHGPNVLQSVYETQLNAASGANHVAIEQGEAPLNIFTSQFFDLQNMGGSGATLGLVLAMFLFCKSPGTRSFAILASLPALCNVNEPLIYGLPIVLNPVFAVPFLLIPALNTIIMYLAMSTDLVPLTGYPVAWTTPPIINGYAVTGSVNGAIVQGICLFVSMAIYAPFVRLAERIDTLRGEATLRSLAKIAEEGEVQYAAKRLLSRIGDQKRLALALAGDLEIELKKRNQLFLEYQPQVCQQSSEVCGVEALLRWDHPIHGRIPPPVIIQLAEELGIMPQLGSHVLEMACAQRKAWKGIVPEDFVMAVNVAPAQILNGALDDIVFEILDRHNLSTQILKLEITESTMLIPDDDALASLERLRDHGVRIALDDFGMGHTSLRYLKALPLDEVKIDRSLTLSGHNEVNEHIISSILDLSKSLDFKTIVEGVETEDQLARMMRLGCTQFQGYYFCRPQSADDCLKYILATAVVKEAAA